MEYSARRPAPGVRVDGVPISPRPQLKPHQARNWRVNGEAPFDLKDRINGRRPGGRAGPRKPHAQNVTFQRCPKNSRAIHAEYEYLLAQRRAEHVAKLVEAARFHIRKKHWRRALQIVAVIKQYKPDEIPALRRLFGSVCR